MDRQSEIALLEGMARAAAEAGAVALGLRNESLKVEQKDDSSPVTGADVAAEAVALEHLARLAPDIPIVAEERVAAGQIPDTEGEFFLVDALDGTKEFIKGGEDFTANIVLIRAGRPVLGAVAQPAAGKLFAGGPDGAWLEEGGERRPISVRKPDMTALAAVASKSHRSPETDEYLGKFQVGEIVSIGSSLKFCLVAEGKADIYPRLGRTMEWDTGAGHAVLLAAGGIVRMLSPEGEEGPELVYGKRNQAHDSDFANPFFVAAGDAAILPD